MDFSLALLYSVFLLRKEWLFSELGKVQTQSTSWLGSAHLHAPVCNTREALSGTHRHPRASPTVGTHVC